MFVNTFQKVYLVMGRVSGQKQEKWLLRELKKAQDNWAMQDSIITEF